MCGPAREMLSWALCPDSARRIGLTRQRPLSVTTAGNTTFDTLRRRTRLALLAAAVEWLAEHKLVEVPIAGVLDPAAREEVS